ncbi:Prune1 [Symbiodinium sp. KB8]|nr:Prune1 [Symbiodinium sp. KB8]
MAAAVAAGSGLQALLSSARKSIEGSGPLLLAIGNEAADADSIISALGLAALVQQLGCSAQPVPLASCSRAQGALKPELAALLKYADMKAGDLLYVDDFPWADAAPRAQVALVDHNAPEGAVASHCSAEAVVAILDHHVDGGACKHVTTCSLVGYAFACSAAAALGPGGAAHALPALLGSVILLDTARLQDPSKTTPLDIAAVAALSAAEAGDAQAVAAIAQAVARGEHVACPDEPPAWATLHAAANAAKFDPAFWAALTLAQALRMDTKVRPCTGGGGTVAVAAVLAPLQSLLVQGEGQPPLAEQALGVLQEAQADTLVIMTLTLQDGTPHRQLALLTPPTAQHMHAPLLAAVNAPEAGQR